MVSIKEEPCRSLFRDFLPVKVEAPECRASIAEEAPVVQVIISSSSSSSSNGESCVTPADDALFPSPRAKRPHASLDVHYSNGNHEPVDFAFKRPKIEARSDTENTCIRDGLLQVHERRDQRLPDGFLARLDAHTRPPDGFLSSLEAHPRFNPAFTQLLPAENPLAAITTANPGKVSRQFWKSGDFEIDQAGPKTVGGGMDHVRVHPKFLHSNATSHKWALGAIAELMDNALDEVANGATFVNLDMIRNPRNGEPMLQVEDDGGGMNPDGIRQCMSLGYSAKSKMANTIGQYGNGFKTSTMRLGADVIVFSRCGQRNGSGPTESIGILSYTFLRETGQQDIIVPIVDYEIQPFGLKKLIRSNIGDWNKNMETIKRWSPYSTESELFDQFKEMKSHGTKVLVYNLWEDDQGQIELDFDASPDDIQVQANRDERNILMAERFPNSKHYLTYQHSLRSYASILYLRLPPKFRMYLRGKEIEHHNLIDDLMFTQALTYKPQATSETLQLETGQMKAVVTVGFVKDAKEHIDVQGFNVYHKNRLIKPFWRLWHASASSRGRGIIGVLEANFVEPAHDKQGFERTVVLARLEARLLEIQKSYWNKNCHMVGYVNGNLKDGKKAQRNYSSSRVEECEKEVGIELLEAQQLSVPSTRSHLMSQRPENFDEFTQTKSSLGRHPSSMPLPVSRSVHSSSMQLGSSRPLQSQPQVQMVRPGQIVTQRERHLLQARRQLGMQGTSGLSGVMSALSRERKEVSVSSASVQSRPLPLAIAPPLPSSSCLEEEQGLSRHVFEQPAARVTRDASSSCSRPLLLSQARRVTLQRPTAMMRQSVMVSDVSQAMVVFTPPPQSVQENHVALLSKTHISSTPAVNAMLLQPSVEESVRPNIVQESPGVSIQGPSGSLNMARLDPIIDEGDISRAQDLQKDRFFPPSNESTIPEVNTMEHMDSVLGGRDASLPSKITTNSTPTKASKSSAFQTKDFLCGSKSLESLGRIFVKQAAARKVSNGQSEGAGHGIPCEARANVQVADAQTLATCSIRSERHVVGSDLEIHVLKLEKEMAVLHQQLDMVVAERDSLRCQLEDERMQAQQSKADLQRKLGVTWAKVRELEAQHRCMKLD